MMRVRSCCGANNCAGVSNSADLPPPFHPNGYNGICDSYDGYTTPDYPYGFYGGCTNSDPACGGPGSGYPSGVCRCRVGIDDGTTYTNHFRVPAYVDCVRFINNDHVTDLTGYYTAIIGANSSGVCY
ncbi:unnamed protein product [Rotaria sp. Silwood1]|nr:unnamed protein product [Rotaria sp. Silwood1]CAF5004911.1 unnamed protein product [Rotaria sp. Silwood1]